MLRRRRLVASLLAWCVVWAFWLVVTHRFHPTFALALIVTTSLVVAYASAAYLNHLVLIPCLRRSGRRWLYVACLAVVMAGLTASALAIIRLSYIGLWSFDPDPYGVYKHFLIDLFGMAVHLVLVLAVVRAAEYAREIT